MARWSDIGAFVPSPNYTVGRSAVYGLVIHAAIGTYDGTISWFKNPGSSTSSTFVAAKDGRAVQMVDTSDSPWTQGDGNGTWLSLENETMGEPLTDGQLNIAARLLAKCNAEYGVPIKMTDSVTGRGLGWHGMGGVAWGGHPDCPGEAIKAQFPEIIARATRIAGGTDSEEDEMALPFVFMQCKGDPTIYQTDGVTAHAIGSPGELGDRAYLARRGILKIDLSISGEGVKFLGGVPYVVVSDRKLIGTRVN